MKNDIWSSEDKFKFISILETNKLEYKESILHPDVKNFRNSVMSLTGLLNANKNQSDSEIEVFTDNSGLIRSEKPALRNNKYFYFELVVVNGGKNNCLLYTSPSPRDS